MVVLTKVFWPVIQFQNCDRFLNPNHGQNRSPLTLKNLPWKCAKIDWNSTHVLVGHKTIIIISSDILLAKLNMESKKIKYLAYYVMVAMINFLKFNLDYLQSIWPVMVSTVSNGFGKSDRSGWPCKPYGCLPQGCKSSFSNELHSVHKFMLQQELQFKFKFFSGDMILVQVQISSFVYMRH